MTPQPSRPLVSAYPDDTDYLDDAKKANGIEGAFNYAAAGTITFKESAIQDLSDMISDRDSQILKELVDVFLAEAKRQIQSMLRGIRNDDMSLLFLPAHSLKSSSATFGAMRLANLSQKLEDGLSGTRDNHLLSDLVEQIDAEYAKVSVAMLNALAEWRE